MLIFSTGYFFFPKPSKKSDVKLVADQEITAKTDDTVVLIDF